MRCCITLNEKCRKDVIDKMPDNIKCISTFSIGFDHIDLDACKARGIKVGNAPHGVTAATAEIAMLLLLGSARRASEGEHMIRTRSWPGWQPLQLVGQRLDGKKLGIYGFGKIGQALAQRARGFDMEIHYYDIYRAKPEVEAKYNATYHDSLDSLLSVSQFFSINAPSTPETRGYFNKATIEKLPQGAIVVNTARGDLVKDADMIAALKSGRLAYAGLDVFAGEPKINEGYYDLPNTFLFPHLGRRRSKRAIRWALNRSTTSTRSSPARTCRSSWRDLPTRRTRMAGFRPGHFAVQYCHPSWAPAVRFGGRDDVEGYAASPSSRGTTSSPRGSTPVPRALIRLRVSLDPQLSSALLTTRWTEAARDTVTRCEYVRISQLATRRRLASLPRAPTSCTPTGRPSTSSSGSEMHGMPR